MNPTFKKLTPHLIAYFVLMAVAFMRFAPVVFQGKALQQGDNIQAVGMQMEMRKLHEKTGEYPLWTNSMFAGMPAFQILYPASSAIQYVSKTFLLGNNMAPPHTGLLLMMAGFYLLLIVMGVDWRVSVFGALGYGLAANHLGLLEAGHSTKIIALAYVPPTLAAILLTFRGKYWLGGGLTALFMALQLYANHVQITYYFLISMLVFGVAFLVDAVKKGTVPAFFKAVGITAVAVGLAVATNAGRLMTTQEYAEETIRGQSELTQKSGSSGSAAGEGGLSKTYAFDFSYGVSETFNLLVPNFAGGSSSEAFAADQSSATYQALGKVAQEELAAWGTANGLAGATPNEQLNQMAQEATAYWGPQRFTSGGVYMGAVFVLLFFLGLVLVKNPVRWYVVAFTALAIMLAWGKNFAAFNYFIFDNFPMYSKFRDVKTILSVANMLVIFLGMLGLQAFFDKKTDAKERLSALYVAGGIVGGLVLFALMLSFSMDFQKEGESLPAIVAAALKEDRAALLRADAFRSLIFIALAFGVLWLYMKKSFAPVLAVAAVGVLAVADNWLIGNRFIGADDYVETSAKAGLTRPTKADEIIAKDVDPYYRVADFRRGSPFSNALTSYHHLSIGGYHAAKLMRYQEFIEKYLQNEKGGLQQPTEVSKFYGMLNAKYFIYSADQFVPNKDALGNAWFVKSILNAPSGDAELAALANLDPAEQVVIQDKYMGNIQGFNLQYDSTATIELTRYHPDTMTYKYSAASDQLAVFSEIYYPPSKGWSMYLDGQKTDDFTKANFLLRAAKLPAGQHELKMVFSPKSYHTGETISLIASLLVLILAGFGIYWFTKHYELPDGENLPSAEPAAAVKPVARKPKVEPKKRK